MCEKKFPKSARLRTRRQFQRLTHPHQRKTGCFIFLDISPNQTSQTRLGITVTKRFGKSHDRNRFKRLVREAFRLCRDQIPIGLDLIVKPRSSAHETSLEGIQRDLLNLTRY